MEAEPLKVKNSRGMAAWIGAGLVASGLLVVSLVFPSAPADVPISAEVHRSGDVSFLLAGAPSDATSPACGCTHSHVPGGWRGIVLPARQLVIAHPSKNSRNATQYDISNSSTQTISALPMELGLNLRVAVVAVPDQYANIDPLNVPDSLIAYYEQDRLRTDWLSVIASGPMHVRSHSKEPVAALSPPENRWTDLEYSSGGAGSRDERLQVRTGFRDEASEQKLYPENDYPVLDVLGPSVTMWAPINGVKFPYTPSEYDESLPDDPGEEQSMSVSQWRGSPAPSAPPGWTTEIVVQSAAPSFATRVAVRPVDSQSPPSADVRTQSGDDSVVVAVPHVTRDAARLVSRFEAVDRDPRFWLRGLSYIPTRSSGVERVTGENPGESNYRRGTKEVEYPPTPPRLGINVFGLISDLKFSDATADLTIGTSSQTISAGTPLEFRNIEGNGILGHRMLVPVRVNGREARIHVVGEADTRINGVPVANKRPWISRTLSDTKVSFFLGLVSALSFLNGFRIGPLRKRIRSRSQLST